MEKTYQAEELKKRSKQFAIRVIRNEPMEQ
jgi:hypothetical protein